MAYFFQRQFSIVDFANYYISAGGLYRPFAYKYNVASHRVQFLQLIGWIKQQTSNPPQNYDFFINPEKMAVFDGQLVPIETALAARWLWEEITAAAGGDPENLLETKKFQKYAYPRVLELLYSIVERLVYRADFYDGIQIKIKKVR